MACNSHVWGLLLFGFVIRMLIATSEDEPSEYMSKNEREALKDEARDMFYHAYNAYMDNAYPADELMPLTCKGRYRGSEPNRGDIDSTLGNFSLTLVDTLDTLVVLGDLEEFENAVKLVTRDVSFDTDVIVSLFETNIRMLGGLLSGHILAEYLQQRADIMPWYKGELLDLAKDLGYRFLPAFNTTTGIPYGRINLKYGMKGVPLEVSRETCTACAGSMILEMAALSRLTGESVFEEKAQKAMDVLWRLRHRGTDLMGSVLNVNSGDWVRRDSGVGAGIDSYYEYCLKAYILLGDEKYLGRFNKHYQAVMKYVSQGPMLLDVHMHRPNTNSKNFMDALLAFWPGLQVLKGDIKPAVETHEMLYQVMQRHNFIPEAFTTDFQVHWGHHPLRPEFLESTYFLYRATGDHYYLGVGRKVLKSLQTYARVPCGYAAVSDVRTNKHDDAMDSFVLSETFKYLFLLFAEPNELVLELDEFIFTTEGHLLPLTLASVRTNISSHDFERDVVHVDEFDRTCPNSLHLFPASVRQPLRNMVEDVCPRRSIKRRLSASQFQANNVEHLKMLSDMGITTLTLADGRVQLLHTFSNAKTPQDSEEGLLFMQEMVELSKMESQETETKPQIVTFIKPKSHPPQKVVLLAGPAQFGPELQGFNKVVGKILFAYPTYACSDFLNPEMLAGKIVAVLRGHCMFIEKARRIQSAGALAGIVLDNVDGSSAATSPMFAMSGDGRDVDDVKIPVVFLFATEAIELVHALSAANFDLTVTIGEFVQKEEVQLKAPTDLSMFERLKGSLKSFLTRQITAQTSTMSGSNIADITVPDTDQQENEVKTVTFLNLRADIVDDFLGGEVRITVVPNVPISVDKEFLKIPQEQSPVEAQWRQWKEVIVNEIYNNAKQKESLHIRMILVTDYFEWITKSRDKVPAMSDRTSSTHKVMWFLMELSEFDPNPSINKLGHLLDSNKQLLLKQHLLTQMDSMVLNLQTNADQFSIVTIKPEMEQLVKITELYRIQTNSYSFLRHVLSQMLTEDDVTLKLHMRLLNNVCFVAHNTFQDILLNRLRWTIDQSPVSQSSFYDKIIDRWQRNLNTLRKRETILWETTDESVIGEIITNESKKEVEFKEPFKVMKKKDGPEKFEDFEYFMLKEIELTMKNIQQNTLHKIEEINEVSGDLVTSEKSKSTVSSNKIVMHSILHNQSQDENSGRKDESIAEKENNSVAETRSESQDKTLNIKYKTEKEKKEKGSESKIYKKPVWDTGFQLLEESTKIDINNEDIVSNDERSKLLLEIQKAIIDEQANFKSYLLAAKQSKQEEASTGKNMLTVIQYQYNIPLEEFKKPVWASDEEKVKHFTEFRAKSDMSSAKYDSADVNKLEYQEDYVVKLKNGEDKVDKHERKHIDDEL